MARNQSCDCAAAVVGLSSPDSDFDHEGFATTAAEAGQKAAAEPRKSAIPTKSAES